MTFKSSIRTLLLAAATFFTHLAVPAHAQTSTITASNLKMAGAKITTGTVTFTPVNAIGTPIPFTDGTGSLNGPTAFSCAVVAGAITGSIQPDGTVTGTCSVPDATQTIPANILYQIQVSDTSTGRSTSGKVYTMQSVIGLSGSTWALDHYGPPAQTTNIQAVQASQGPTTPTACVSPSVFTNTATSTFYTCVNGVPVPVGGAGTGAIGPAGATGATGPVGPTGPTGAQGPAGATGATGATGANGVVNMRGTYNVGTAYAVGDGVSSGATTYVAIAPGTGNDVTNTSFWTPLADAAGAASSVQTNLASEVSRATAAESLLAPRVSPVFTGNPTGPTPTAGDNSTSMATTSYVRTALAAVPQFSFPTMSGTVLAHWDFHEGTGTTVNDISGTNSCSGAPCSFTLVSGTPAGTLAPKWITGINGIGVGLAFGVSGSGAYGLPTTVGGSSCQVTPITQNQIKTIFFQAYNDPAIEASYPGSWANQIVWGSSVQNGQLFYWYNSITPLNKAYVSGSGGNTNWIGDNGVALHDYMIRISGDGINANTGVWIDGKKSTNPIQNSALANGVGNLVLGCHNGMTIEGSSSATAHFEITDMMVSSSLGTDATAQQYHAAVSYALSTTKGYVFRLDPVETGYNQALAAGDSTTAGSVSTGTTSPWATCLTTTNCYGTSLSTALPAVNGVAWSVLSYGMPGQAFGAFTGQAKERECKVISNGALLRPAIIWTGINGLSATTQAPVAWVNKVRSCGWDPWVMTLYSLNNTAAADQVSRDPYNNNLLYQASSGDYKVVNIAEDQYFIDGTNGNSTGWCSVGSVHLCGAGYARVASIVNRVWSNYYLASSNLWTTYSATGTNNGWDRYVIYDTTGGAITRTLTDCIGMGGSRIPYMFQVKGTNGVTLVPPTVSGQTEQLNGGTSNVTITNPGTYTIDVRTLNTATAGPGGCNYQIR